MPPSSPEPVAGIGFALAETLADEGYGLTVSARKPDTLEAAAERLRERGFEVEAVPAEPLDADATAEVVARHRERFGRLDVLVNNAGVGIGATATEHQTKHVDLQLAVNVRAIVLFYRESIELLRAAGRRAPQRARGEPGVDGRQVAPAVAVGVLGDEGGGRRATRRR